MNANQMGRAAYIAAHKILTTNLDSPEKACPGMRRSIAVDRVAEIIMDVFGAHSMACAIRAVGRSGHSKERDGSRGFCRAGVRGSVGLEPGTPSAKRRDALPRRARCAHGLAGLGLRSAGDPRNCDFLHIRCDHSM